MNYRPTPTAYFAVSEQFDYRRYMEERSHNDAIVLSIEENTAHIVGGMSKLGVAVQTGAKEVGEAVDRQTETIRVGIEGLNDRLSGIDDTLSQGFSNVTIRLDQIHGDLEHLTSICAEGYATLSRQLARQSDQLDEIVTVLRNPDLVWAEEKYRAALDCVRRGLWEEGLVFVTRAIEGDDKNTGYSIEPKFHYVRGMLRTGGPGEASALIDLNGALADFQAAARYAAGEDETLRKQALTKAGFVQYLSGNPDDALTTLVQADGLPSDVPETSFLLAKLFMHLRRPDDACDPFKAAVTAEPFYAVRADNDGDFFPYKKETISWLRVARDDIRDKTLKVVEMIFPKEGVDALVALAREEVGDEKNVKSAFQSVWQLRERTQFLKDDPSISDINDFQAESREFDQACKLALNSLIGPLRSRISSLELADFSPAKTLQGSVKRPDMEGWRFSGVMLGIFGGILAAFIWSLVAASKQSWFWYIFEVVLGTIIYGFGFAIVGGVGGWILGMVGGGASKAKMDREHAQQRAQLELEEQKRVKREQEEMKAKHAEGRRLREQLSKIESAFHIKLYDA